MRPCATTLESELTEEELECLLELIHTQSFGGNHLEIGTAAGGTLWQMMKAYHDDKRPSFVVIDPMKYFPNQLQVIHQNLKEHGLSPDTVDFRVGTSEEIFPNAERKQEKYDLIFIDGAHKVRYVMQDLKWSRLLNRGGLLILHDFSPNYRGVWYSVNRFLKKNPHYSIVRQVDKLIALQKDASSEKSEISSWDITLSQILSPIFQLESSLKKRIG